VVIPTFNRASLLKRSIKSVIDQTYTDLEVIVVDDASTDETEEVVRGLEDHRIRYLRHEKNRGGSAARNTGISAANGKYIAFQDSDDEWFPDKLKKQVLILEESSPDIGVVYSRFWRIDGENRTLIPPRQKKKEGDIHRELLKRNFISTQAAVVKRECFSRVGLFDESLPRLQDWDLFIRLSRHYKFSFVDEPLVNVFSTQGNISSNPENLISALVYILEKHKDYFRENDKFLASNQYLISNIYCSIGDIANCKKYLTISYNTYKDFSLFLDFFFVLFGCRFYLNYLQNKGRLLSKFK